MTGMVILVHFDQGLCFRGRLTAMKRSIVIPTKLKIHERKETKPMYRLVLHKTIPKLPMGETDLGSKYLINVAPVQDAITKSPHAMLSIRR